MCCALWAALLLSEGRANAARPIEGNAVARLELLGFPLGPDAFARAVATKHRPLIDLCFGAKLDVNATDDAGRTPLLIAALDGDWETVKRLLAAGASAEVADAAGSTPLMAAAMHGNVEMTRIEF